VIYLGSIYLGWNACDCFLLLTNYDGSNYDDSITSVTNLLDGLPNHSPFSLLLQTCVLQNFSH
jgi:hypothetical protein